MSSIRLQDISSRRLQYMSSRRLEDVFSVTIFRLARRLQDVLREALKTSSRRDVSMIPDPFSFRSRTNQFKWKEHFVLGLPGMNSVSI